MPANRPLIAMTVLAGWAAAVLAAQVPPPPPSQGQTRDAQGQAQQTAGTGLIAGRVTLAGTGQPVEGVRVTLNGSELRGSRSALTDDDGQFVLVGLPAGTFTLRGTRTGYIAGTFGQKRPGQPGTPIALADGQQLKGASFEIAKGGVITGAVFDEKNRPAVGTPVRVMRWTMTSGERTLSNVGSDTTDDRGIYRVYNLMPGDYLVSAMPRNTTNDVVTAADLAMQEARLTELASRGLVPPGTSITLNPQTPPGESANTPVEGYAPVFFPGTTDIAGAQVLRLDVSQEHSGIDFGLTRVSLTSVTGSVITPPGVNASSVQIRLLQPATAQMGIGSQTTRTAANGTFTFRSVVPGQYVVFATSSVTPARPGSGQPGEFVVPQPVAQRRLWAQADVFVDGSFAPAVTLSLQDGVPVTGQLAFDGSSPLPAQLQRVRVTLAPQGQPLQSMGIGSASANADASGRFVISAVVPGRYRVTASGAAGWSLKSVLVNGIDALDFGLEIPATEPPPPMTIQFGDRNTELRGVLSGADGAPTAEYSVIVFPEDQRYWVPFARRMRSARPATDGKFAFTGLPPGDYRIAAVTDVDSGEWMDPEFLRQLLPASLSVRLLAGQPAQQDIRVR